MPVCLGLDIGSNSVGSAWVDTERGEVHLAAGVFPAGVDEQEDKRGAPKNQARRRTRSQRRTIHRRAQRKHHLLRFLMNRGLLPQDPDELRRLFDVDPWALRRKALREPLTAYEFGRVLVHLAQRRGAVGIVTDPENPDEGRVKDAMDRLKNLMQERGAGTVGQLLADLIEQRRRPIQRLPDDACSRRTRQRRRECQDRVPNSPQLTPIRNRQYRLPETEMLFAGRELVRDEFHRIVRQQRSFENSPLAGMLTDDLVNALDDPTQSDAWRHRGLLFGQRRTYWDTGTLGRCVLEPTERCVPIADRHASYFRVIETVNNIRIERAGQSQRPLTPEERDRLVSLLRGPLGQRTQKGQRVPKTSASVADIKKALGVNPRDKSVRLNIEADEQREINTDWFHREIVHGAFGEAPWNELTEQQRESVNRAILKFDPDHEGDASKLHEGAQRWWGLDQAAADRLVEAWKARPKLEKRLNLSRRAIRNLLRYMEPFDAENKRWPTQQEARRAHAAELRQRFEQTGELAYELAARRYATGALGLTAADRYYMRQAKHQLRDENGQIIRDENGKPLAEPPPAPMLSNPVVRKAIHEVRRHLVAWLRQFRRKPDRVVIEMARATKQSGVVRDEQLKVNRMREGIRTRIIQEHNLSSLSLNQQRRAVDRVLLARQQRAVCPYCGKDGLGDPVAAKGDGVEIDHIVPYSRSGDDSLNNKVLVHANCNQGKRIRTPKEWLSEDDFAALELRLKDFEKAANALRAKKTKEERRKLGSKAGQDGYFTISDYARKWRNFNHKVREEEEFRNSQLTDTAYAAREVAAYLADALFDGRGLPERGDGQGRQRIFFTVGKFTLMLRRDWQLFETLKPPRIKDGRHGELTADQERELADKNRGDHRQHAIDAAAIALTDPKIKNALATWAAQASEHYERYGRWPRRTPTSPPWADVPTFRRQVLSQVYERFDSGEFAAGQSDEQSDKARFIVSHRPVKRRLVGALHEETHYGPVVQPLPPHRAETPETLFTNRISADRLTPNHLRVPDGWDKLSAMLEDHAVPACQKQAVRRQLAALQDPAPAKSGIVRDRALRDRIRKCLRANGLDPDDFGAAEIKNLVAGGKLTMASGVPIKSVVLLRTNTDPVIIPRKRWDLAADRMVADDDQRTRRVYIGGNNHHIEIREDRRTGKWRGEIIRAFEVARRVRLDKLPAVDRADHDDARFVMSLSEGEMIYARRKDRPGDPPDYYVVCKLDKVGNSCRIHFAPHWDARKASEQDRWDVTPADLKHCGPEAGEPPVKVRVGPLGDVRVLQSD